MERQPTTIWGNLTERGPGTRSKSRDVPGGSGKSLSNGHPATDRDAACFRRPDPCLAAADLPQHVTQEGTRARRRPDPCLAAADLPQHVTQEGTRARRKPPSLLYAFFSSLFKLPIHMGLWLISVCNWTRRLLGRQDPSIPATDLQHRGIGDEAHARGFDPSSLFGQSVNQQVNRGYGSLAPFQNGRSGSVARFANAEYEDERERMKRERNARESENAWKERENTEKERNAKEEKEREERERERKASEKKEREEEERKAKEEREREERERKAKEQKEREKVERKLRKAREAEERAFKEEQRKENERKTKEEARARKISEICDLLEGGRLTDVVNKYEKHLPRFIESRSIPLDLIEKSLKNLSDRVVLQYFRKFYGTYELRERLLEAIALRAETVLSNENELFEELKFEAVNEILSCKTLCVHEITVLLAVRSWLKHGWNSRKNYMKDVMSLVRFGSMSMFDVHLDPCFSEAKQPKELHIEGLIERILTDKGRPRWRSLDTMPLSLEEGASPFHCPQFKGEDFVLEFSVDKPVKFAGFFQYATLHNLAKQTGIQRVKWSLFKEGTVVAGPFNIIEHHFEKATFASGTSSVQLEPEKLYVLCASFSAPVKCFECPPKQFVLRDERYATPDVTCTIERAYCELSHNETELHVSPFYKLFFISSTPGNGMPCIPDDARYMKQRPTRATGLEEFSEPPTISPPLPVYYHVSIGKETGDAYGTCHKMYGIPTLKENFVKEDFSSLGSSYGDPASVKRIGPPDHSKALRHDGHDYDTQRQDPRFETTYGTDFAQGHRSPDSPPAPAGTLPDSTGNDSYVFVDGVDHNQARSVLNHYHVREPEDSTKTPAYREVSFGNENPSFPSYGGRPGGLSSLPPDYSLNNSHFPSSYPPTSPSVRLARPDGWWINNGKGDSSFEPKLNPAAEVGISLRNEVPSPPRTDGFGCTNSVVNAISSNTPDGSPMVVSQFNSLASSNPGGVRPLNLPEHTDALRPTVNGYDPSMQNGSYQTTYGNDYVPRSLAPVSQPAPAGTLANSTGNDSYVYVDGVDHNQATSVLNHNHEQEPEHSTKTHRYLPEYCEVSFGNEKCRVNGERIRTLSPKWNAVKAVKELHFDHPPAIVRPFIHFVNTGCLPDPVAITRDVFVGLYDLGKCYEITDEAFNMQLFTNVQNHVSDDHGALLFYYKNLWEYPDVRKMCAKGFLYDAEQILSQLDAVKELGFEQMNAIFSMDPLEVHELTMFKALTAWASEPRRKTGDVIVLLRKIRFGAFPLLDYYSASGPFHVKGLLNVEEKMKVVQQISSGASSGFSPKARLRSKDVMEVHLTRGLINPRDSEIDVPYAISFVVSKPVRMICMYKITGSSLTDQLKVRWALMEGVEGARHPNGGPFTEQLMGNLGNSPHIVTDQKYPVLQLKRDTVYTLVATFSAPVVLTKMTAERKFSLEHPSYSNVVCEVLNGVPQCQGLQQNHLRAAFNEYGSGYGQYNDRIDFSAIYNADVHSTPFTTLYFLSC